MQDVTGEIRRDGVNRDRGSSSSVRAEFGCSVRTHAATEGGDKNKCQPFGEETHPPHGGRGGPGRETRVSAAAANARHVFPGKWKRVRNCCSCPGSYCVVTALAAVRARRDVCIQHGILSKSNHFWEKGFTHNRGGSAVYLKKMLSLSFRRICVLKIGVFGDVILFFPFEIYVNPIKQFQLPISIAAAE